MMTGKRWRQLMESLGFNPNEEAFDLLTVFYSESHRHYHTAEHINACLNLFDIVKHLAERPDEVELAIWFHDAIYQPMRSDNELRSAEWAKSFLIRNSAARAMAERVYKLITTTLHNAPAETSDEALLVGIDLSILGAAPPIYEKYEKAIRQEYRWVPYFLYRKKRREILTSFLSRERIYDHRYFTENLEQQARINLALAVKNL